MTPERFSKLKHVLSRRQPDLSILATDVHKPHNISAILRTCDAVGIHRIHAVSTGGEMRRHHMCAGGAGAWVDIEFHPDIGTATETLHAEGWTLLAAHPEAKARDYREIDYTRKVAIMLGSELDGLDPDAVAQADEVIALPIEGMVASLNVSVAAAVILYEAQRQRSAAGLYEVSRLDKDEFDRVLFEWSYPEIAARCLARGIPYPGLNEEGELESNPLAAEL
ncbi:MAG TPA: tRNA (guanosine(18)-2'-O)-methyltransferase TrmH [Gammaproteobacteria bacterium]